jgi:hypothetical protein
VPRLDEAEDGIESGELVVAAAVIEPGVSAEYRKKEEEKEAPAPPIARAGSFVVAQAFEDSRGGARDVFRVGKSAPAPLLVQRVQQQCGSFVF